ncbi:MAG: acetate/propionate family kinase [Terriglobales bacterium]
MQQIIRNNEPTAQCETGGMLALNSGSSSIKFALFDKEFRCRLRGTLDRIGLADSHLHITDGSGADLARERLALPHGSAAVQLLSKWLEEHDELTHIAGVGHRIVHGGPRFEAPEKVTASMIGDLRKLTPFAPNHLPMEIDAVEAIHHLHPSLPQVVCFDTAFHRTLPVTARLFALPRALLDRGVMRYGFHGLSYESIVNSLSERKALPPRLVIAHLGNGASLAAIREGCSVDTTMGMTPTGGIPMGTRSGDIDPGVLLYLLRQGYTQSEVEEVVEKKGGLLGLSGTTSDMKDLLARAASDTAAAEAVDIFCYAIRKTIAAYAAVLGGLDAIVFTGGIGENAAPIRAQAVEGLSFLGIHIDPARNTQNSPVISPDGAPVLVRVMATDEELVVARHTQRVLALQQEEFHDVSARKTRPA